MSTRPDATYDDATTTNPRTDPTTEDFSTAPDDPTTATDRTPTPHEGTSWTERCKRQFSTTCTSRMQNLNDDQNQAMQDGI